MKVTEVRIKLTGETDDRLLAFCSVTLDDCFVVRDLKIIDGSSGPFVAMPSRKLTSHCPRCHGKNHLRSNYCTQCGADLRREASFQTRDNSRLYADIAHPINAECRELIQTRVIEEFEKEQELAELPGYRSRYDDDYESQRDDYESQRDDGAPPRESTNREPNRNLDDVNRDQSREPESEGDGDSSSHARPRQKRGTDRRRHRKDPAAEESLQGPHESPHQSEQSANSDDEDDQFGAGIL